MSAAPEPLLYNLGETATLLRIHRATVSRLISSGALPVVRLGSRTLVRRADLEKLLDEMTTSAVPEAMADRGRRVRAAREAKRSTRK
jgi:excisionase family DNA binding protein